eukprot:15147593-Alexandrium_andersonii.AAC.1
MPPRQRWAQGEWTPPAFHATGSDQTGTANGLTWHAPLNTRPSRLKSCSAEARPRLHQAPTSCGVLRTLGSKASRHARDRPGPQVDRRSAPGSLPVAPS